jgi:hypothetical protein
MGKGGISGEEVDNLICHNNSEKSLDLFSGKQLYLQEKGKLGCRNGNPDAGSLTSQKNHHSFILGDQKLSVHLMITTQKVKSNVQSVPRQSPDIY